MRKQRINCEEECYHFKKGCGRGNAVKNVMTCPSFLEKDPRVYLCDSCSHLFHSEGKICLKGHEPLVNEQDTSTCEDYVNQFEN